MDQFLVMKNITKVYDNGIMANNNVNFSAKRARSTLFAARTARANPR